jgi:hypothetical protein
VVSDTPPPLIRYTVQPVTSGTAEVRISVNGRHGITWPFPSMGAALRAVCEWSSRGRVVMFVSGRRVSREVLRGQMLYHTCRETPRCRQSDDEPCEYIYAENGRTVFAEGPPCWYGTHARPKVVLPVEPTPYVGPLASGRAVYTATPSAPRSRHVMPKLA